MNQLGLLLRSRREERGFSLAQLGHLIGFSRQYLFAVEMGDATPSRELCRKLGQALKIDGDVVMILAGHLPPDVMTVLQENPQAWCATIRGSLRGSGGGVGCSLSQPRHTVD